MAQILIHLFVMAIKAADKGLWWEVFQLTFHMITLYALFETLRRLIRSKTKDTQLANSRTKPDHYPVDNK